MNYNSHLREGVTGIIARVQRMATEIGAYQYHFFDDNAHIIVQLSNGKLRMPEKAARKQEARPTDISDMCLTGIAASFQRSTPPDQHVKRTWLDRLLGI